MIGTSAKVGGSFCTRVAGKRFRMPCQIQHAAMRTYSVSLIAAKEKSGEEHHSFFQQQMMELEKEQKEFGGAQDGDSSIGDFPNSPTMPMPMSSDLQDQLSDWQSEQKEVFGETLAHHDGCNPSIPDSNNEKPSLDLGEREARFEFTQEDMAAWGKPTPEATDMQNILEQVALERQKEDDYTQSASLSPQTSATEEEINATEDHHESFSHVSTDGSSVHMVDVGHKAVTQRTAHARSEVWLPPDVLEAFLQSKEELVGPKGPIFATAKIAGIMACKRTSDLIPLCHPLPLDQVKLDIRMKDNIDNNIDGGTVVIDCTCKVTHKTGVEMEALTGATVAALTIYDMTKAVSHNIKIRETRLMGKTGGKRTVLDGTEKERLP